MQITIRNTESDTRVTFQLPDERRALANLLSFLDITAVTSLEICDMQDAKFPKSIQRLSNLRELRLIRCHALTSVPSEITRCPLRELAFIKCADFHDLGGISKCSGLEVLHVSGCDSFDTLPEDIGALKHLRALDLSYSESIQWIDLSVIPDTLKILDMHGCWQAEYDSAALAGLQIASLQIQDTVHLPELIEAGAMPELDTQLRHILTVRDCCVLDS